MSGWKAPSPVFSLFRCLLFIVVLTRLRDTLARRKPGPAPRVAFVVTPLPHGESIKFLACRTILRGTGWDFYFLFPLPKKLCFILAWRQNATTPFSKHYKTTSRPNLLWCFNWPAVRDQGQVDAEGSCARMRCSSSPQTLWVVSTCHFCSCSHA